MGVCNWEKKKIDIEEKVKEILEEKDEVKRELELHNLNFRIKMSFKFPHVLDELLNLKFSNHSMNYAETEVNLILYCILVNGLDKTKGEKFDQIKKEMQPLIKILKEIFCEFDKNEIHKERTFIFALRSPAGFHDDFYIINNKDDILSCYPVDDNEVKSMFLSYSSNKVDFLDSMFFNSNVSKYYLDDGEKEYKL